MSSSAVVKLAGSANAESLRKLLAGVLGSDATFWWESESHLADPAKGLPEIADIERSRSGRAFNSGADVEWRRAKQGWHVTVLGDDIAPDGFTHLPGNWQTRTASLSLIGTRVDNGWRDTRFPRTIVYPDGTSSAPSAEVLEYIDADTGLVQFVRLVKLEVQK